MSSRKKNYANDEDILLCQIYMRILQDPTIGTYESSNQQWNRVEDAFIKDKDPTWPQRTQRSMQARIQTIEKATKKFRECLKQLKQEIKVELHVTIKEAAQDDPNSKLDWKFSHVWEVIKNFEKFQDCAQSSRQPSCEIKSSDSESQTHNWQALLALSSFNMCFDYDGEQVPGDSSSSKPKRVKKAKLKTKILEDTTSLIMALEKQNELLKDGMENANSQMALFLENQKGSIKLKQMKEENKILSMNLSSINYPQSRAFFQAEKKCILREKAQQEDQPNDDALRTYSFDFNDIGGSGSD
ncbi:uncharacterized protein LOC121807693 [Salvia splendens]|uniref:uncharacterized protein LOC121807693 n=1 Tax=Salvia splendens TaxID=180675 RepID=UPI001C25FEA6|nr:uncharacterized protein LOC121807693 [Salvia splendens]